MGGMNAEWNYMIFCTRSDVRGNELRKVRIGEESRWDELFYVMQIVGVGNELTLRVGKVIIL